MNLGEYYKITFSLAQHHKYSISDIENMIPFERDIYVEMLLAYLDEQKKEMESRKH